MTTDPSTTARPRPWWKHGYLWLVIAGPAAVVLATIPTVWLALTHPETIVPQESSLAAAMQARNHVATPKAAH